MQLLNLSSLAPLLVAVSLMEASADRSWASNLSMVGARDRAGAHEEKSKKNKNDGKDDKRNPAAAADCRIEGSSVALADLPEASGLAVSRRTPGILWSHVDSGAPVLFALDIRGSVKGRVRVEGVKTNDWEDVAVGSCGSASCVYIADIGDNQPGNCRHRQFARRPSTPVLAASLRHGGSGHAGGAAGWSVSAGFSAGQSVAQTDIHGDGARAGIGRGGLARSERLTL